MLQGRPVSEDPVCPECLRRFNPRNGQQLFCCAEHRTAWNNRWTVRGRQGMTLFAVAMKTRNGTRPNSPAFAARASKDANALARAWEREDVEAKRMTITEYNRRRYALGLMEF